MANKPICSIPGCGKPSLARGWCSAHWTRWQRNGSPLGGKIDHGSTIKFIREVALNHDSDACLIWPYHKTNGYGMATWGGRSGRAHRFVCEIVHGKPPYPRADACHSCGDRACVNPKHLRWGTRRENMQDTVQAGRQYKGTEHIWAKLDEQKVREIRSLKGTMSQQKIADKFGLTQQGVSDILRRKAWAWLK